MKYVIVIEPDSQENPDFGVIIPDLPGCYSQGDDLDEAIKNAHEAACLWIDTALDEGMQLPHASTFSELQKGHPEWAGWLWSVVDIDLSKVGDQYHHSSSNSSASGYTRAEVRRYSIRIYREDGNAGCYGVTYCHTSGAS